MAALPGGGAWLWAGRSPFRPRPPPCAGRTWAPCRCAPCVPALWPGGRAAAGVRLGSPARRPPCRTAPFGAPRRRRPRGARSQQGGVKHRLLSVRPACAKFKFSPRVNPARGIGLPRGWQRRAAPAATARKQPPEPGLTPRGWPDGAGRTETSAPLNEAIRQLINTVLRSAPMDPEAFGAGLVSKLTLASGRSLLGWGMLWAGSLGAGLRVPGVGTGWGWRSPQPPSMLPGAASGTVSVCSHQSRG